MAKPRRLLGGFAHRPWPHNRFIRRGRPTGVGAQAAAIVVFACLASSFAGCLSGHDAPATDPGLAGAGPTQTPGPPWPALDDARIRPGVRITWNGPPGEAL